MSSAEHPEKPNDSLRSVQLKQLEIWDMFYDFCRQNNLRIFFCGGALIGAVRHKGFIPWDDDIDCYMYREDYERLPQLFSRHKRDKKYVLQKTTQTIFADTMVTQICDSDTTFVRANQCEQDINHGVKIEIIPLDRAGEGAARKMQLFWALVFVLFNRRYAPKTKGKAAALIGRALLWIFASDKAKTRVWKTAERRMTKWSADSRKPNITELTVDFKYVKNLYPKEIFESIVEIDFEGRKIPAPIGYDKYLTIAFGDYMTPPPPEERISGHDPVFIDMDTPYTKYRGIQYLKNK